MLCARPKPTDRGRCSCGRVGEEISEELQGRDIRFIGGVTGEGPGGGVSHEVSAAFDQVGLYAMCQSESGGEGAAELDGETSSFPCEETPEFQVLAEDVSDAVEDTGMLTYRAEGLPEDASWTVNTGAPRD